MCVYVNANRSSSYPIFGHPLSEIWNTSIMSGLPSDITINIFHKASILFCLINILHLTRGTFMCSALGHLMSMATVRFYVHKTTMMSVGVEY